MLCMLCRVRCVLRPYHTQHNAQQKAKHNTMASFRSTTMVTVLAMSRGDTEGGLISRAGRALCEDKNTRGGGWGYELPVPQLW